MPYNYPYSPYPNLSMQSSFPPPMEDESGVVKWVAGIEGTKKVNVPPNKAKILMDSENEGVFYIKSCDSIGISTLRTFLYEEVTAQTPNSNEYVTKQELEKVINELKGALLKNE